MFFLGPSQPQRGLSADSHPPQLLLVCPGSSSISHVRFIAGAVSGALGINETTEYPESLCPMSALPPLERREPSLRRALPLLLRSYGLMRQSRHLSATSAYWPRSRSLRRLPSAPAAHGTFSTLFCESFLSCLSPYPGGSTECACLVLPQRHRPSPNEKEVGFPLLPANTTFHGPHFGAAAIPLCSGLRVCLPPGSFLPLQVPLQGS